MTSRLAVGLATGLGLLTAAQAGSQVQDPIDKWLRLPAQEKICSPLPGNLDIEVLLALDLEGVQALNHELRMTAEPLEDNPHRLDLIGLVNQERDDCSSIRVNFLIYGEWPEQPLLVGEALPGIIDFYKNLGIELRPQFMPDYFTPQDLKPVPNGARVVICSDNCRDLFQAIKRQEAQRKGETSMSGYGLGIVYAYTDTTTQTILISPAAVRKVLENYAGRSRQPPPLEDFLKAVMIHESGHLAGLAHPEDDPYSKTLRGEMNDVMNNPLELCIGSAHPTLIIRPDQVGQVRSFWRGGITRQAFEADGYDLEPFLNRIDRHVSDMEYKRGQKP